MMYKNFSLMQIPQEKVFTTLKPASLEECIENLSKDYRIPKPQKVMDFIKNNDELVQYINSITPLINSHFPDNKKCLTFCKDSEFEELDDITIYICSSKSGFDKDWEKLDELEKELFYLDGFSNKTKGLISVDLWLN